MSYTQANPLVVLSLGAGVQSTTALLMSCKGDLPRLDAAIFADTQWEPREVYTHLEWLKGEAKRHGIPVLTTTWGDIRKDTLHGRDGKPYVAIPAFVTYPGSGKKPGRLLRTCTSSYKIYPVRRVINKLLREAGVTKREDNCVLQWLGISTDEAHRMKPSQRRYIDNVYPLIDKMMSRDDCIEWVARNYEGLVPPKSACIGCPFRSNASWSQLNDEDFADAVAFDEELREHPAIPNGKLYIHSSCKTLDRSAIVADGAPDMFGEECMGMCGV